MACINPDGTITESARAVLKLASSGPLLPEDIASTIGQPLFRIRSSLRELSDAGFVSEQNGAYETTDLGKKKLGPLEGQA